MNFSDVMREESKWTKTENGADAKNTTDSALLDMFATIGAMRTRSEDEIVKKFELAFQEDSLGAMRCLFYARDIHGGLGERRVFRVLLTYIANKHTEELRKNIDKIPEYGRWDDVYSLVGTKLEDNMWDDVKYQLLKDKVLMKNEESSSLLAKWLKKADASSPNTRKLGIYTAKKLGMSVYDYKRLCNRLRKHIDVVEQRMSARQWDTINYPAVPSRAMMNYRKAFARHDQERFEEYINKVSSGEQKINAATLYPYDIVEKILYHSENSKVLEAQWDNLPNYVDGDVNAVVMADVSGSMYGRPMATSIGLAMYFAERNKGAYHNLFMTFSGRPKFVEIKGNTITQKINFISRASWQMNTDLEAALMKILDVAIENHCSQEEMPKSLIIISDMEIDCCTNQKHRENFYDYVSRVYKEHGYKIPNVVFWNVNSRHDVFLADKNRKGVQLVSGQSVSTFKNLIGCVDKTPVEMMYSVLNSDRYQAIQI
ncbi:Domain of uncharacterised function (DUF2828) [Blautia hydrogenotrophica]|jgi:hypothetical protein|uniref:DUF2828 domain-containing protein n=1 Tax=Blautia hydrogenotrophica (strain DSM 10507 / JCM 14656 / S5a33) TaxID=476272 RepID=C0CM37_BLAHS|nr:DUF2828 family protein [Blautia hydrogenotrophica]SCI27772.1 Domain of uncharacterised function (DUF2828) [uncultured Blautia sp.]DAU19182.1 MAG TPA: protein of unknown function (DUF2828) [Caudoviricetes sp.]EEG49107.1 hypothetical protein RUMHYD_01913 [Blautia hydrogenotrophica DSM 10507]MCT6798015.1 DUF2828 family protein [Blautia hydrogenotrophica]WPX84305.1 hypothetical protein BLHYD_23190 [Blautia hydrogenotrophica DSM 10507]